MKLGPIDFPDACVPPPRKTFRCTCCGQVYERGRWQCCGPQGGQTSAMWLESWCDQEDGLRQGERRCPRHCHCSAHDAARAGHPLPIAETRTVIERLQAIHGVPQGWTRLVDVMKAESEVD